MSYLNITIAHNDLAPLANREPVNDHRPLIRPQRPNLPHFPCPMEQRAHVGQCRPQHQGSESKQQITG